MKKALALFKSINKENWKKVLAQFIKFGIIGVSNTLISTGIYYIFVWIDPGLYFWGNAAGWLISILNSFYWNNRFVFKDSRFVWWKKLLRTYIAYGGGFLVGSLTLFLQVHVLGVSEWLAPWLNLIITVPVNFLLNKFWAFQA